jgi:hypothetical protein
MTELLVTVFDTGWMLLIYWAIMLALCIVASSAKSPLVAMFCLPVAAVMMVMFLNVDDTTGGIFPVVGGIAVILLGMGMRRVIISQKSNVVKKEDTDKDVSDS